jgi:hypothetical protein
MVASPFRAGPPGVATALGGAGPLAMDDLIRRRREARAPSKVAGRHLESSAMQL